MKYYDYDLLPFELHVIQTDKFKTVEININFNRRVKKEEITKRVLLSGVLSSTTKNLPTERLMSMKRQELYSASIGCVNILNINELVLQFSCDFLNPKYTEPSMLKESLDFLISMIMEPNVIEDSFAEDAVNQVKKRLKKIIVQEQENNAYIAQKRLLQELAPDTPLSYSAKGYLEEIDSITGKELYEYYQDILKRDVIDIYVCGDVQPEQIKSYFLENFKIQTVKKPFRRDMIYQKNIRKRSRTVIEKKHANQSNLVIGCKLDKLTPFEKDYVSIIFSYLFGLGSNSKLFKVIREKHSFCYNISSHIFGNEHVMLIQAGIDATNFKKTVEYIKKLLKEMEKGQFDDEDIENYIRLYSQSLDEIYDSQSSILSFYASHIRRHTDMIEERKQNILKVDRKSILKLAKKIHLDTIYLLEGDINHE